MHIDRNHVIEAFKRYTADYNAQDPKILLKIRHTYRVAGLCEQIALSLAGKAVSDVDIPDGADSFTARKPDPDFAWLCGMLHDTGRFEQVRRYNTFSDALSVDHAMLGADLLFKENLLETFVPEPQTRMSKEERALLELSIRSHSLYRIPEDLNEKEQMYCNILRDADKIDIFRVNCDTPAEDIYNVTTEELKSSEVSPEVKDCFYNRTAVLRSLKKTPVDFLAGHICLYFELVYDISRELAWKQGYLQKMLDFESENPQTREWFLYMKEHIRGI